MDTAGFMRLAQCNTEPKLGSQHNVGFVSTTMCKTVTHIMLLQKLFSGI